MRKQQNQESIDAATAEVKKEGSKKDLGSADNPTPVHSNSHEETGLAFRKKPVVIQAIEVKPVTSSRKHLDAIRDFMGGEERRNIHFGINYSTGEITINTLEGTMKANIGDWIIRGVKGEFYPCKPDIFEATYERVLGSEVPTQKAPTDSSKEKENATSIYKHEPHQSISPEGKVISALPEGEKFRVGRPADHARNDARRNRVLAARVEPTKDTERLDWLEKRSTQLDWDYEADSSQPGRIVYEITGNVNDRVWTEVGKGFTLREAIDNASCAVKEENEP